MSVASLNMYVANCTEQVQTFTYRIKKSKMPIEVKINPGGQERIPSKELTVAEMSDIYKQNAKYGLIHVSEIDTVASFSGLCFGESPISANRISYGIMRRQTILKAQGEELRKAAAIMVNKRYEENTGGVGYIGSDVSVVEIPPADGEDTELNETIRVSRHMGSMKGAPPTSAAPRASARKPKAGGRRAAN